MDMTNNRILTPQDLEDEKELKMMFKMMNQEQKHKTLGFASCLLMTTQVTLLHDAPSMAHI